MTGHIDQLTEWWENAEQGSPNPGDTIIINLGDRYVVEAASEYWAGGGQHHDTRILARAPKPKPAWHDALAVMARCSNAPEGHREPFIRSETTPDVWIGEGGNGYTDDLRDVTPLIEAKVTDETIDRVLDVIAAWDAPYPVGLGTKLAAAALGLEAA